MLWPALSSAHLVDTCDSAETADATVAKQPARSSRSRSARPWSQLFPERVTSAFLRVPGLAPAGYRRTRGGLVFDFQRSNRSPLCRFFGLLEGRAAVRAPLHFAGSVRLCRPLLPRA